MKNRYVKRPAKEVRIVLRVEPDTAEELHKYAVKADASVSAVVRRAIKQWLKDQPGDGLPFRTAQLPLIGFAV